MRQSIERKGQGPTDFLRCLLALRKTKRKPGVMDVIFGEFMDRLEARIILRGIRVLHGSLGALLNPACVCVCVAA